MKTGLKLVPQPSRNKLEGDGPKKKTKKQAALDELKAKLPQTEKAKRRAIKEQFGSDADAIQDMLESKDNDNAITLIRRRTLSMLVNLMPLVEQNIIDSEGSKGIYQLNILISQMRETMADIANDQDKKFLADTICERILKPKFMDVATKILDQHRKLKNDCKDYVEVDEQRAFSKKVQNVAMELAQDMSTAYNEIQVMMEDALKG